MRNHDSAFSLAYVPLTIHLTCCADTPLPAYLGSTLRGVVGWALQTQKEAYYYIFENRRLSQGQLDVVNPYIIEPPKAKLWYHKGESLTFTFILFGEAIKYQKAVVEALIEPAYLNIGVRRAPFQVQSIIQQDSYESLWQRGKPSNDLSVGRTEILTASAEVANWCSLQLQTPLRIRRKGNYLTSLDFPTLIRNSTKRVELLTDRYGGAVNQQMIEEVNQLSSEIKQTTASFMNQSLSRYSNRKHQKMDFSGMLGIAAFEGDLTVFTPWLKATELLHIGRNTTFGHGKITITLANEDKTDEGR